MIKFRRQPQQYFGAFRQVRTFFRRSTPVVEDIRTRGGDGEEVRYTAIEIERIDRMDMLDILSIFIRAKN